MGAFGGEKTGFCGVPMDDGGFRLASDTRLFARAPFGGDRCRLIEAAVGTLAVSDRSLRPLRLDADARRSWILGLVRRMSWMCCLCSASRSRLYSKSFVVRERRPGLIFFVSSATASSSFRISEVSFGFPLAAAGTGGFLAGAPVSSAATRLAREVEGPGGGVFVRVIFGGDFAGACCGRGTVGLGTGALLASRSAPPVFCGRLGGLCVAVGVVARGTGALPIAH